MLHQSHGAPLERTTLLLETDPPLEFSIAIFGQDGAARKQPAKAEQQEARLAEGDVPENARGLVARVLAQRPPRRCIHQIDQAAVVGLLELVDGAAYQKVQIEFAAQGAQFAAFASIEDCLADAERASEAGDDPSDSRNFYLSCRVADQKYASRPYAAFHWRPAIVHRNARALESERGEPPLFHELLEAASRFLAIFTDQTQHRAFARFGNQPIKVGRVVGHEPDANGVQRHVCRNANDGLNQGNGRLAGPPGGLRDARERSVGPHDNVGVQLIRAGLARAFDADAQAVSVALERYETVAERNLCALAPRPPGKAANQLRAFNNQIRAFERNLRGASVGKQFEFADFVDDGALPHFTKQGAHVAGDDQRARRGIEFFGPLEDFHGAAGARQKRRGEET